MSTNTLGIFTGIKLQSRKLNGFKTIITKFFKKLSVMYKIVKFLNKCCVYDSMEYQNNDLFDSDGPALIIFINAISVAVSLLGILICIKVTNF